MEEFSILLVAAPDLPLYTDRDMEKPPEHIVRAIYWMSLVTFSREAPFSFVAGRGGWRLAGDRPTQDVAVHVD